MTLAGKGLGLWQRETETERIYIYTQHYFSTRDSFALQVTLAMSEDTSGGHSGGEEGGDHTKNLVMEARAAAKPPSVNTQDSQLQKEWSCAQESQGWETPIWRCRERTESGEEVWGRSASPGLGGSLRHDTNWKKINFLKNKYISMALPAKKDQDVFLNVSISVCNIYLF